MLKILARVITMQRTAINFQAKRLLMKRNQFTVIFAGVLLLTGLGSVNIATAQSLPVPQGLLLRICVPSTFDQILQTDLQDVNLSQRQQRRIEAAYNDFLAWSIENMGGTTSGIKCFTPTEGVSDKQCFQTGAIAQPYVTKYLKYETAVRQTLNRRQAERWDRNMDAIRRGEKC